jgi:hypothetical protein
MGLDAPTHPPQAAEVAIRKGYTFPNAYRPVVFVTCSKIDKPSRAGGFREGFCMKVGVSWSGDAPDPGQFAGVFSTERRQRRGYPCTPTGSDLSFE